MSLSSTQAADRTVPPAGDPPRPVAGRWAPRLRAIQAIWIAAPAALWAIDYARGRHNNYRIFKHVWCHLVERSNLYLPYPAQHADTNHYGPLFGLVIAPFALLPDAAGGLLWNVAMAMLLFWATGRMGLSVERRALVLLVSTLELLNANWSNQFNPAVAALLLLTFADVEAGRDFRAPLWCLVAAFVKIYGLAGLLFVLFARDKRRFLAGSAVWFAVLLVAPMAFSSPAFVLQSYRDWYESLVVKNSLNLASTSQDISIPGVLRRAAGLAVPGALIVPAGLALLLAPLLRRDPNRDRRFRIGVLASVLLFLVLFSSGSESATYVVAATGAGLWLALQDAPFRPRNLVFLAGMLLAALAPTDLLSVPVRLATNRLALKAIPFAAVWFLLGWELLTGDFAPPADRPPGTPAS